MDGVRLTTPTILGHQPQVGDASDASGALVPYGVVLVIAGSRGHKLACRYPEASEEAVDAPWSSAAGGRTSPSSQAPDGMVHGLPPAVLADLLMPKPRLCGQPFDLTVGAKRFIGGR